MVFDRSIAVQARLFARRHPVKVFVCALLLALGMGACERDPDLAERELFTYLAACPGSMSQCQQQCSTDSDISGNGIIEGPEEQLYNVCISNCQNACAQAFLFYLLTDEGN